MVPRLLILPCTYGQLGISLTPSCPPATCTSSLATPLHLSSDLAFLCDSPLPLPLTPSSCALLGLDSPPCNGLRAAWLEPPESSGGFICKAKQFHQLMSVICRFCKLGEALLTYQTCEAMQLKEQALFNQGRCHCLLSWGCNRQKGMSWLVPWSRKDSDLIPELGLTGVSVPLRIAKGQATAPPGGPHIDLPSH